MELESNIEFIFVIRIFIILAIVTIIFIIIIILADFCLLILMCALVLLFFLRDRDHYFLIYVFRLLFFLLFLLLFLLLYFLLMLFLLLLFLWHHERELRYVRDSILLSLRIIAVVETSVVVVGWLWMLEFLPVPVLVLVLVSTWELRGNNYMLVWIKRIVSIRVIFLHFQTLL